MNKEDDMSIISQGSHTVQDNLPHRSVSTAIDDRKGSTQQYKTTDRYNLRQSIRHPKKQFD